MLDQSFSFENFRIILDVENRRGVYIEQKDFFKGKDVFKISRKISEKIVKKNGQIRKENIKLKSIKDKEAPHFVKINKLKSDKEKLIKDRENSIEKILLEIGDKTSKEDFTLTLQKGNKKYGSQLYIFEETPENYFTSKQIQRNIFKTFNVKQSSRSSIIEQLKTLLNDNFPKLIIRTDIKSFYESIPHDRLLYLIERNSLLSYPSKKIIRNVLNQYWSILIKDGVKKSTDKRMGIPRGIGFSAYLSELYLRGFDTRIKSLSNISFYKRYVDDIIMIITPNSINETKSAQNYKREIENILKHSTELKLNKSKTKSFDLRVNKKTTTTYSLTYLGYKFIFGYKKIVENKKLDLLKVKLKGDEGYEGYKSEIDALFKTKNASQSRTSKIPLVIRMSDAKFDRYKLKIDLAFKDYRKTLLKYPKEERGASILLLQRMRFLTKNFQLISRKSNVFIGVYFSNEFLSKSRLDLVELDNFFQRKVRVMSKSTKSRKILKKKLALLSFKDGFENKSFTQFSPDSFKKNKILKIWTNI